MTTGMKTIAVNIHLTMAVPSDFDPDKQTKEQVVEYIRRAFMTDDAVADQIKVWSFTQCPPKNC